MAQKIKLAQKETVDVGKALMAWRKSRGLTRRQAAAQLGVNHRTLEAWEYGRRRPPSFSILDALWASKRRPLPSHD